MTSANLVSAFATINFARAPVFKEFFWMIFHFFLTKKLGGMLRWWKLEKLDLGFAKIII